MTAPSLLRADPARLPHPRLIDVHVHLSADGEAGLPATAWPDIAASAGVAGAFAFPPLRGSYAAANAALRDWAATSGGAVRPFARLGGPVPTTVPALWQLRRAARSRVGRRAPDLAGGLDDLRGFAGVKMLPHLDGWPSGEALDAIDELGLPVLVHAGEHLAPDVIEKRLVARIRGPVVLGHLGAFPASAPHLLQAVAVARRHERVLLETSAAWLAEFVALAAREVPGQVVFGSDAPLVHPLVAWRHVASAVRDDEVCERIAHRTAEEVLGW